MDATRDERMAAAGRGGKWLRLVLFNVLFVALPLGLYFLFYVDARVEQITVRNFRALDAAAVRLAVVVDNLPRIAGNVPLGVSSTRLTDGVQAEQETAPLASSAEGERGETFNQLESELRGELAALSELQETRRNRQLAGQGREPMAGSDPQQMPQDAALVQQRINRLFSQAAAIVPTGLVGALGDCDVNEISQDANLIDRIYSDWIRDFEAVPSSTRFKVEPLLRDQSGADSMFIKEKKERSCSALLRFLLGNSTDTGSKVGRCTDDGVSRHLVKSPHGVQVEVHDCQPFQQRAGQLASRLTARPLRAALDQYGIRIITPLSGLVDNVAANVAPLFDQFLLTDADGRVLYTAEDVAGSYRFNDVTGAPVGRRVRHEFINHVDLRALVNEDPSSRMSALDSSLAQLGVGTNPKSGASAQEWDRLGVHSRMEEFRLADMGFTAFVHPFAVDGLSLSYTTADAGAGSTGAAATANDDTVVLYLVGIVNRDSLNDEALKLRLSLVADALILIGVLFASFSVLWLWTAGDRLVLRTKHFLLFLVTGLTATYLVTLFAMHLVTRNLDGEVFDRTLQTLSVRMRDDFASEIRDRVDDLLQASVLMMVAGEAESKVPEDATNSLVGYACRGAALNWPPAISGDNQFPGFELAFLLDGAGRQWQCLSYRLFDTPALDLAFRDYFKRPRSGRLWQAALLPEVATEAGESSGDPAPERPKRGYFMDRITSVLDGTTETVLSMQPAELCRMFAPEGVQAACLNDQADTLAAAVIIGRLQSLEEAVLPAHFRFAVIDNRTGQTLFHSVKSRSLATNFIRQVGGNDALLAHVDAQTTGLIDMDYHGTSIRGYVAPLGMGLPWTLVTYRGHELEDTLGIMTVSASTLDVLVGLTLVVLLLGVLWLFRGRDAVINLWPWRVGSLTQLHEVRRVLRKVLILLVLTMLVLASVAPMALPWLAVLALAAGPGGLYWAAAMDRRRSLAQVADASAWARVHASAVETGSERRSVAEVTVLLMVVMAVLPTTGFFLYHRAEFSAGLALYLRAQAELAIGDKCARHRDYALRYKAPFAAAATIQPNDSSSWGGVFCHGWLLAGYDESSAARCAEELTSPPGRSADTLASPALPGACRAFPDASVRSNQLYFEIPDDPRKQQEQQQERKLATGPYAVWTGFSGLATDLYLHMQGSRPSLRQAAPGDVMDRLLGLEPDQSNSLLALTWLSRLSWLWLLSFCVALVLGVALVMTIVLSLTDRVLGVRLRLALLPEARIRKLPSSWVASGRAPLRACVLHRSETLCRVMLATLLDARQGTARIAIYANGRIEWQLVNRNQLPPAPQDLPEPDSNDVPGRKLARQFGHMAGDENHVLHVVEGLERLLLEDAARNALLLELERLLDSGASVLVCTRLLPGFWLARMAEQVSGDVAKVSARSVMTARWAHVIGPLDVRRLMDRRMELARRFKQQLGAVDQLDVTAGDYPAIYATMQKEALANPELLELAAAVTRQVARPDFAANGGDRVSSALQRFAAGAAGYFHEIWAASTREERLQMYALAKNGFVNPHATTVLSSLANRGIIDTNGIVVLQSRAFANFIANDLVHDHLLAWCDEGHGNVWRSIWPPILVMVILTLAFFVSSTPEALAPLAALVAAGFGAVPVVGSLMRSFREMKQGPAGS